MMIHDEMYLLGTEEGVGSVFVISIFFENLFTFIS